MFELAGENITVARELLNMYDREPESFGFTEDKGGNDSLGIMLEEMITEFEKTQPVRKIKANRRSITGWVNGFPDHDPVPFESKIERDCAYQLLFDKRIRSVHSQPLTITFPKQDPKNRFYTPDYLVEYKAGKTLKKILIECKPEKEWETNRERLTQRYNFVANWAKERGMSFVLLTEKDVSGPSLKNIQILYPRILITTISARGFPEHRKFIRDCLPTDNETVLDKVKHLFPSRKDAQSENLSMIAAFDIVCDLTQPLEMSTVLHNFGVGWEPPFLFDTGVSFDV